MSNSQNITYDRISYSVVSNTEVLSAPENQQLLIHSLAVSNGTGSAISCGIASMFNTATAKVYENEVTPVLAADGRNPDPNNGLVIVCPKRFDLITFDSKTGTAALEYWNGSAWTSLSPIAQGSTYVRFNAPVQWVVGGDLGLDATKFQLKLTDLTAVADLKICKFFKVQEDIPSLQFLEIGFEDRRYLMEAGEAIIPFFETANAANIVEMSYRINP